MCWLCDMFMLSIIRLLGFGVRVSIMVVVRKVRVWVVLSMGVCYVSVGFSLIFMVGCVVVCVFFFF